MHYRTKARGGLIPGTFLSTTNVFDGRLDNITPVNPINQNCGHARPIVRNVVRPDGPATYLCRSCFSYLRNVEVRAIEIAGVRRQLDHLFRGGPLGFPGAALEVAR